MDTAAINLFDQSEAARKRGDKGAAKGLLQSCLKVDPSIPGAWYNLASDLHNGGDRLAAVAALSRALELAPGDHHVLTNLGWNLHNLGRYTEAARALLAAIEADPGKPTPWTNLSMTYCAMHLPSQAIGAGREAVRLGPDDPQAHLALAFALLFNGQCAEGFKEYEWRFQYKMPEFLAYAIPKWDGSEIDTLFVPSEQGLGDTLQFGRFLPLAAQRVKKIIFCVQEELYPLIRKHAKLRMPRLEVKEMPVPVEGAEAFCPLMSLPVALGMTDDDIAATPAAWFGRPSTTQKISGKRRKIGICWAGSPDQDNDRNRSASLVDFLDLYHAPGIQLYSFQVGDTAKDCRKFTPLVIDAAKEIRNFEDTAKLITQMDAVVTVCTSVAHLAGTLGVPTHIVLPRHGQHFVWGYDNRETPWYPSVRLYRQQVIGEWASAIRGVANAL